ncbi:hypothetical protein FB567DRAFT_492142 [Paraphoma chrysanthemicola]|uniref:PARP catalytic domain-containing protein n=1 Tax=Paraphoma chrysanthemicola TaxID=798071 RepID=A0A8K0RBJ8_9PLEO|nr:hypothetical protein FB567DRAFT_492142 [Paraphoma chrysanthemicola]
MTAKSLRALLTTEMNVMQGSYWGLESWLQCLIAANHGNPASVTDLEALWARRLLPFATHGSRAAEWFLAGMCQTLREVSIPNMGVLPEFSVLMKRAIADHSTQLDGFRLRGEWAAAYEAVQWMQGLVNTSPLNTPPGHLLPEHILDSQFPIWRLWANWKPTASRIQLFTSMCERGKALLPNFMELEGPSPFGDTYGTLREGLIAQYSGGKSLVRWRGLIVEVPCKTKTTLRTILERVTNGVVAIAAASGATQASMLELFVLLFVARPVTASALDLFEATVKTKHGPSLDIFRIVCDIYRDREQLGGRHILELQHLMEACNDESSEDLRTMMLQGWLRIGIENCLKDCQRAVKDQIGHSQQWIHLALDYHSFCCVLKASEHFWPLEYQTMSIPASWPSREAMEMIADIYSTTKAWKTTSSGTSKDMVTGYEKSRHPLLECVEAYCVDRLSLGESMSYSAQRTMSSILHVWESTCQPEIDVERRKLAILTSGTEGMDSMLSCRCLSEIATGKAMQSPGILVRRLLDIFELLERDCLKGIIALTHTLMEKEVWTQCWKDLLYLWLEQYERTNKSMVDRSLQAMNAGEWLTFMRSLEELCASSSRSPVPSVLHAAQIDWTAQLVPYTSTLTRLEQYLGQNRAPVRCLLSQNGGKRSLAILGCLKEATNTKVELLMHKIVGLLSDETENHGAVGECLLHLSKVTPGAIQACFRVWDMKHGKLDIPDSVNSCLAVRGDTKSLKEATIISSRDISLDVVEVVVAGWTQGDAMNERDKQAIASVASVLGLRFDDHSCASWKSKLMEATAFWEKIEAELITEATRLKRLQKALKAKDPRGTARLLQELGIPNDSLLDDEIANLPAGVVDSVEKVGETEIEITFPLSALTQLQRKAMGIPTATKSLLLRISKPNLEGEASSFCVHFDNEKGLDDIQHAAWICSDDSRPPHKDFCTTPHTVFVWQLQRFIYEQFRTRSMRIVDLHRVVKKRLEEMGHFCISCGSSHNASNARLRRATPCSIPSCARLWYELPLEVRIPEIKTDTFAVDAMLTSVYAAAVSGRPELLPGCPIRGAEAVKATLNALPSLTVVSHAVNISAVLRSYHKDAEKLISWACVQHRGYLATATGLGKIPSMPVGTHQFVLANASPTLERNYLSKLPKLNPKTMVLFHGTTFDRLPAILAQGLKVCSGTSLQKTGAAHGKGIYLAEDPATSLTYSSSQISWRNSGLTNTRLLLGCEVIGTGRSVSPGIHVITDTASVMVRYVFFLTSSASAPIANHIVPAMGSAMSALRMGVL